MLGTRKVKVTLLTLLFVTTIISSIRLIIGSEDEPKDNDLLSSFYNVSEYYPSNRYTHKDDLRSVTNILDIDPLVYDYLTTTGLGDIYLNEEDLSFRFRHPKTNYVYGSTIDVEGQKLTTTNKQRARSAINISYFDAKNNSFDENLFTSKDTTINVTYVDKGFNAKVYFGESKIKLDLNVAFNDSSIKVNIPSSSIEELGDKKLKSIRVYSYFGAVNGNEIPGYMFIPDGTGALIRYDAIPEDSYKNYYKEIYGEDISFARSLLSEGEAIYLPVFGFVHGVNQNAVLGIIESGAPYAAISATHASKVLNFYTIYPEFIYRKTFRQPVNAAGHEITLLQNFRNDFDIDITYEVLTGNDANYIGMAKKYQSYLVNQGVLTNKTSIYNQIPLNLEVILNEKKRGVFTDEKIIMTKFKDYKRMMDELKDEDITNINSIMLGFTHMGFTYTPPYYESIDKDLGSLSIFDQDILDNMYFRSNFQYASSKVGNYNAYNDLALSISEQVFTSTGDNLSYNLLSPKASKRIFTNAIKTMNKKEIKNLAIEGIPTLLFSDYKNGMSSRDDVIKIYQSMFEDYNHKLALYQPNDYMFKYMDSYLVFPLYNSQYLSFDDTVPFLSIVLKGYVDLFASNANFYPNARDELLRLIDFGVSPSFIISEKSSHNLLETNINSIFTSRFDDLKESIVTYYNFVNGALEDVYNASIINREVLEDGIIKVTYDNDYQVYINYTSNDFSIDGQIVRAKDYVVRRAL